jgi:hypothetical protein
VLIPHPLEQLLGRDGGPVGGHQRLEHGELLAGQLDLLSVAGQLPASRIELELLVLEHGRAAGPGPPRQSVDTGHQLGKAEGLGQVVIGAQGEAIDHVLERAGGGQHENAGLRTLAPHRAADIIAVHPG